jgi:hypothetical protein
MKWAYHGTAHQKEIARSCKLLPRPSEDDGRKWLFFTDTRPRASYYARKLAPRKIKDPYTGKPITVYEKTRARGVVFRFPWPSDARPYNAAGGEAEEWTTAKSVRLDQAQVLVRGRWVRADCGVRAKCCPRKR